MTAQSMASPDNDWRATASFENLQDGFRVRLLVSAHDGTAWSPIDIAGDGVGYTYPSLKYWSPDSRYFFFAERVAGGSCDFFPIEDHWKRLDVRTGKLDDYPLPEGRGHAISRDGSLLAYASAGPPNQVIIEDLAGGVELSLDLHSAVAQAGDFLWNAQSSAIAFTTSTAAFCDATVPSFQVLRFDIGGTEFTPLISVGADLLHPNLWSQAGAILLEDWNGQSWWIDEETGQTVPAPPE